MQQIKRFLFGLFLCVVFLPCVYAKCSSEERNELNTFASNVKVNYEDTLPDAIVGTPDEETYVAYEEFFTININNINERIYVVVTNNLDNQSTTYHSTDAVDGVISIPWKDRENVTTFTFKIYAEGDLRCTDDVLKTLRLTVPRLNGYYYDNMCIENPDFDLCEKYVTYKEVTPAYFVKKLNNYLATNEKEKPKSEVIKEKKTRIAIGAIIVIAVGVTAAVIIKKNRSKEI